MRSKDIFGLIVVFLILVIFIVGATLFIAGNDFGEILTISATCLLTGLYIGVFIEREV